MRAHQNTLAALNAQGFIPNGNLLGDVAFVPLCGARGISAAGRQRAHGQAVAMAGDCSGYFASKIGQKQYPLDDVLT